MGNGTAMTSPQGSQTRSRTSSVNKKVSQRKIMKSQEEEEDCTSSKKKVVDEASKSSKIAKRVNQEVVPSEELLKKI